MKLRIARSTSRLHEVSEMYRLGLGLSLLGSFSNHAGFSGVMLGNPDSEYHFEFTEEGNALSQPVPHAENLIIFYEPVLAKYNFILEQMEAAGFKIITPHNPYWNEAGTTFIDLEGHRVVIANQRWN
jgi:hypothetical protein